MQKKKGSLFIISALSSLLFLTLNYQSARSQTLSPDQTFGNSGWVITNADDADDSGYAFEVLDNGKIIVVGNMGIDTDPDPVLDDRGFGFIRYNSDGSIDSTFGSNGVTFVSSDDVSTFGDVVRNPRGLAIQNDGKILAAGGSGDLVVIRLTENGSLDTTFDSDGVVNINVIGGIQPNIANDIKVLDDGRILVVGQSGSNFAFVARLLSDGTPDTGFSGDGANTFETFTGTPWNAIAVQSDGKVVIGGSYNDGGNRNAAFLRFNTDGSFDNSFGTNGFAQVDFGPTYDQVEDIVIQPDGKIVYTGSAGNIPDRDILHGRLNTDGSPDSTYSGDGRSVLSLAGNDVGYQIRLMSDNSFLIGGTGLQTSASTTDFLLYKVNSDGSDDTSFGDLSAVIFADLNDTDDVAREMDIQSDGKVLLFGDTDPGDGIEEYALLRFDDTPEQNTFIVTNTNDSGSGSLREAITTANNTANGVKSDRVIFQIPTDDPGYNSNSGTWEITLNSGLPEITDPITVDGLDGGQLPLIEVNGASVANSAGFTITAGSSTIAGLIINNFADGAGISLLGAGENDIRSNYIGTDETGEINEGNGSFGVFVSNSPQNRIRDNVLSGNNVGVFVQLDGSDDNIIESNYIGLNKSGDSAIPNEVEGIRLISQAENNLVRDNFIAGNLSHGIGIYSTNFNFVWSNRIGTNSAGTSPIPNQGDGVYILDSGGNEVGGDTSDKRNIISGNSGAGVSVRGTAIQNIVRNNYIGTNITGSVDLGNGGGGGVLLSSENGNIVQQNLISGNGGEPGTSGPGVTVTQLSKQNSIRDNLIGYSASGASGIGNANNGVLILGNSNLIRDNSIASNGRSGIEIAGGDSNTVCGNKIGVVFAENAILHNDFFGIWINSGAQSNYIGGGAAGCGGNLVVDDQIAIYVSGTDTDNNEIYGNLIGKTSTGFEPGGQAGITIVDADTNTVGLLADGFGNTIASMTQSSISISSNIEDAVANSLKGNIISNGSSIGIDLGQNGITANDIGDADSGPNNLQNYPEMISMTYDSVNTEVEVVFNLDTDPLNATYPINIDFYKDSGNRQSAEYLGTASLFVDDFGSNDSVRYDNVEFISLEDTDQIIAIATDSDGNSSEFSESLGFSNDDGGGGGTSNIFVVTNTEDNGAGSLRQAILDANTTENSTQPDSIIFNIGTGDAGYNSATGTWEIRPASNLPDVTDAVIIEGTMNADQPLIEINGTDAGSANGLTIRAGSSTIKGLIINNFSVGSGIVLTTGGQNTVQYNYIGTDETGVQAEGNDAYGIRVEGSASNTISDNLISGNDTGVYVNLEASDGNVILNNLIGTDKEGNNAVPNLKDGVHLVSGVNSTTVSGNVISGNSQNGIYINNLSNGNSVTGNTTGLSSDQNSDLGNNNNGILVLSDDNTISGNHTGGNGQSGITINNGNNNVICENTVGLNSDLTIPLHNGFYGIWITDGSTGNKIGSPGENCDANYISDDVSGIRMAGISTSENIIKGNIIGTNQNGDDLGGSFGIFVRDASSNTIGDISSGNLIAYMSDVGIQISNNSGESIENSLRGNIYLSNVILGLDLGGDNVTANDPGDADEGPNRLQNYPSVNSAELDSVNGQVNINYELDSDPANTSYPVNVDFYLDGGDRQPVQYLGTDTIFENESGSVQTPIYDTPDFLSLETGDKIIAMATDDLGNSSEFSAPISVSLPVVVSTENESGIPSEFELLQNYPNPFNPTTVISFGLPVASEVQVNIFNVLGQRVSTLVDQRLNAGFHEFDFDASGLPSGIYLYRIQTDEYTAIKKMMLVK